MSNDTNYLISTLGRAELVGLLEGASIQCYDDESVAELLGTLRHGLAASVRAAIIVPFSALEAWLEDKPVKVMNTGQLSSKGHKVGWGSKGYGMGWSVPMKEMIEICEGQLVCPRAQAYDEVVRDVTAHYHAEVPASIKETICGRA